MSQIHWRKIGENNKIYTATEYDGLTGYLEREYSVEWTDANGTRWRKSCQVINLGRPDRGTPADPDAAIANDGRDYDGNYKHNNGPQKRTLELLARIREALADKPLSVKQLSTMLNAPPYRIHAAISDHGVGIALLADGAERIYGLDGQPTAPVLVGPIRRIVEYLRAHGPTSTADLVKALRLHRSTIANAHRNYPDVMVEVGKKPKPPGSGGNPMSIWGLGDGAA